MIDDFNVDELMSNVPVVEVPVDTEVTEVTKAKSHGGLIFALGLVAGGMIVHFVEDWIERRKTKSWVDEEIRKQSILKLHRDKQEEVPAETEEDDEENEESTEEANN